MTNKLNETPGTKMRAALCLSTYCVIEPAWRQSGASQVAGTRNTKARVQHTTGHWRRLEKVGREHSTTIWNTIVDFVNSDAFLFAKKRMLQILYTVQARPKTGMDNVPLFLRNQHFPDSRVTHGLPLFKPLWKIPLETSYMTIRSTTEATLSWSASINSQYTPH